MSVSSKILDIHIGSAINLQIDPVLEASGFAHGMLSFSFPSLGISFKCRAQGTPLDLEFGAFFAAIKFVNTRLKDQKFKRARIYSSSPEFVFSFTPGSKNLTPDSSRFKMLREYAKSIAIEVSFIELHRNQSRLAPQDFPLLPQGQTPALKPDFNDLKKVACRPFQKGIQL